MIIRQTIINKYTVLVLIYCFQVPVIVMGHLIPDIPVIAILRLLILILSDHFVPLDGGIISDSVSLNAWSLELYGTVEP